MVEPERGRLRPVFEIETEDSTAQKRTRMPSARRRAQIIEAAIRLIGVYGVRGTTMSRVASEIGLTEMAIYRHFPSKIALLQEASSHLVQRTVDWLGCSSHPSVLVRLREIGEAHVTQLSADVLGYNAPMMQFVTLTPADSDLYQCTCNAKSQIAECLAELVREGKAQGTIRSDVDAKVFAREWVAWAQGEDIGYLVAARDGTFSRKPFLRMLYLILSDIAVPGSFEMLPTTAEHG